MKKLIYTNIAILIYLLTMITECYSCDKDPVSQFEIARGRSIFMNIGDSREFVSYSYDPDDGTGPNVGIALWRWYIDDVCVGTGSYLDWTFSNAGKYIVQLGVQDDDYTDPENEDYWFYSEVLYIYVSEVVTPFFVYNGSYWPFASDPIYVPVNQSVFISANGNPNSGSPDYYTYFPWGSPTWSISPSGPVIAEYPSGYCLGGSYSDMVLVYNFPDIGTYALTAKAGENDPGESIDIVAVDLDVYPTPSVNGTPVMISTVHDDNYHTEQQWADGIIRITVTANPAISGIPVYFRTYDPDDKSSYETNPDWDDNHDTGFEKGDLDVVVGYTTIYDSTVTYGSGHVYEVGVYTNEYGIAEVDLNITDQYAGDNYRVYVSTLKNPQQSDACSDLLVAWKRVYLERDNMYKKGSTLHNDFIHDSDPFPNMDLIYVEDGYEFHIGDHITIFDHDGTSFDTVVQTVSSTSLVVDEISRDFERLSGVMIQDESDTYEAPIDYIEMSYGSSPDGSDGGAFVEFVEVSYGSTPIPKYPSFASKLLLEEFCSYWFDNSDYVANCVQLVAAKDILTGDQGATNHLVNITVIFDDTHTGDNKDKMLKDTVVHELGHHFSVSGDHVDQKVDRLNHAGTDQCIMSYNSIQTDDTSEFCTDCIYQIRVQYDPL